MKKLYFAEFTDTYSGEANYSWVTRFRISANTLRGAVNKLSHELNDSFKLDYDTGDVRRYHSKRNCTCYFIEEIEPTFYDSFIYQKLIDL